MGIVVTKCNHTVRMCKQRTIVPITELNSTQRTTYQNQKETENDWLRLNPVYTGLRLAAVRLTDGLATATMWLSTPQQFYWMAVSTSQEPGG